MGYCADGNGKVFLRDGINIKELKNRGYIVRKSNIKELVNESIEKNMLFD